MCAHFSPKIKCVLHVRNNYDVNNYTVIRFKRKFPIRRSLICTGFARIVEKLWNLRKEFYRSGKSWKMTVVVESHGKVMEFHQ